MYRLSHNIFHLTPVSSLSPDEGAVVPGQLAVGAAAVEGDAADAAGVVVGHPFPCSNSIPALDRHLKEMSKGTFATGNNEAEGRKGLNERIGQEESIHYTYL